MRLLFFDTETTGGAENDRLIQLAVKERPASSRLRRTSPSTELGMHPSTPLGVNGTPFVHSALYRPPVPITIDSMAVHHITEKMVADTPLFVDAPDFKEIKAIFEDEESVAVAHNVAFDLAMLAREGIVPVATICTYKVARALDPEEKIGRYQLQYLRYFLGLEVEAVAHDAMGDVLVLEAIFERLLEKSIEMKGDEDDALKEMIDISRKPMLFTTLRFGKYRGKRIEDVARSDKGYLEWLLREKRKDPAGEADWIYTLEHYLASLR